MRTRARDVMTSPVKTVAPDAALPEVAHLLAEHRIGCLPVVDGGRLVGIVTEEDLLLKVAGAPAGVPGLAMFLLPPDKHVDADFHRRVDGLTAGDVMTANVVTADEDTPVREIAATMTRRRIGRIPVIDDAGSLLGVVSRNDVLRIFARDHADVIADLRAELEGRVDLSALSLTCADGIVRVVGHVGRRSDVRLMEVRAHAVDGVVGVDVDGVTYDLDDLPG